MRSRKGPCCCIGERLLPLSASARTRRRVAAHPLWHRAERTAADSLALKHAPCPTQTRSFDLVALWPHLWGKLTGLTPPVKKVIAFAIDEEQRVGHGSVGTEHLLLAPIRLDEGIAAAVLKSLGVRLEQVRTQALAVQQSSLTSPSAAPPSARHFPEGQAERVCARYGTRCLETFQCCFNCGQPLINKEQI
jgi:hypothetical protein